MFSRSKIGRSPTKNKIITLQPHIAQDSLPVPDNMSDLQDELAEVQKAVAENAARADGLTPHSQSAFADASDTKRATREIPDDITGVEDDLRGGRLFGMLGMCDVSVWTMICRSFLKILLARCSIQ